MELKNRYDLAQSESFLKKKRVKGGGIKKRVRRGRRGKTPNWPHRRKWTCRGGGRSKNKQTMGKKKKKKKYHDSEGR